MPRAVLRVQALSPLRLTFQGRPHSFVAPPRTLPLFAYIIVHRSAPIARDVLAYTLWPDDAEESARTNLRRHIYHLQKTLPALDGVAWLRVTAKTIQWNADTPHSLDVDEFERLGGARDRAGAVELYAGDLFDGLDEEWLLYERERLRNLQAAHLIELIEEKRAQRDLPAALAYAQRLLAHDPWREDAVRHVMSLRYESGDRAGATAEYERFRDRLRGEMGVEPMPETVACFTTIAARAGPAGADAAPARSAAKHVDRYALLPFAGRSSEMERLREAWQRSGSARGSAVLIGGEAGIGKTRLATTFAREIEDLGGMVLRGATSFPEATPYQALAAALQGALTEIVALDLEPVWLAALGGVIPHLRDRNATRAAPEMRDSQSESRRLFEAFARLLEGLARERPVLVVLEDLHWAGAATLSVLESLVCHAALANVLVVATYRDEEILRDHPLRAFRRTLTLQPSFSHVALSPLDHEAVAGLLRTFFEGSVVAPGFVDDLHRRSEGNPFFLTELLRERSESGPIDASREDQPSSETEPAATAGISAVVGTRLRRLSTPALAAAHLAAVIGQAFSAELLREAGGWSEAQTLTALDELQDHHIVHDTGASAQHYTFSHYFVQATAYGEIDPSSRQRRHRRVARVMEELYPEQRDLLAAQLARHFDLAGDGGTSARYEVLAAEQALNVYAGDDALMHAERALHVGVDPATSARAHLLLEEAHRRRGDRDAQAIALAAYEALLDAADDDQMRLEGWRRRIALAHVRGDEEAETAAIAALRAGAAGSRAPYWQGVALQAEGVRFLSAGRLDDARASFMLAATALEHEAGSPLRIDAYCSLAQVALHQTRYDDAEKWLDQAEMAATQQSAEYLQFRIQSERYALARFRENADAVYALAKDLLERSRRIGDTRAEAMAHILVGNAALVTFDVPTARCNIDRAYAMARDLFSPKDMFGIITCKGLFCLALGDFSASRALFEEARAVAVVHCDRFSQLVSDVNLASVDGAAGQPDAVLSRTERVLAGAAEMSSKAMEAAGLGLRGAALRRVDRLAEALEHLERSVSLYRELGMQSTMGSELAELALLYTDFHRHDAARARAEEVVTIARSSDASLTNGHFMLWMAARTFHALGEEERACDLRDAAYALYLERKARIQDPHLERCFAQTRSVEEIVMAVRSRTWEQPQTDDQSVRAT